MNVPAAQDVQAVAPEAEYVPMAHKLHDVAPAAAMKAPAAQAEHNVVPGRPWAVPAAQAEHDVAPTNAW